MRVGQPDRAAAETSNAAEHQAETRTSQHTSALRLPKGYNLHSPAQLTLWRFIRRSGVGNALNVPTNEISTGDMIEAVCRTVKYVKHVSIPPLT